MIIVKKLFFIFCFFPATLCAQTYGLDLLGLAKTDAALVAREADNNSAVGFLDVTFGNPYPHLKILLTSGKFTKVRVHLVDYTCYRNKKCLPGTLPESDVSRIKKRAKRFAEFMNQFPGVEQFVSPALEHDVKDEAVVRAWFNAIKVNAPRAKLVCSAFTGWCPAGAIKEKHGNSAKAAIVSNDGQSLFDSNSWEYRKHGTRLVFGWINAFNGRTSGEKTFTPPLKRVNWPTSDNIKQVVRILREPEPKPPSGCQAVKAPELLKTNAEYYGKELDDGRGDKALFITEKKYQILKIFKVGSTSEIGCLRYYGSFSGGGHRYYIGSCSKEAPTELMDELRSEWGELRGDGRCWLINSVRRLGVER